MFQTLDCTIRDGGYVNNWDFPLRMVRDLYWRLSRAGVDYVEVGFRDHADDNTPLWRRSPEKELQRVKKDIHGAKLSVMVDYGKTTTEDFQLADDSAIDMIRVAVHKDKVPQALDFCEALQEKGYILSIQLMGYPQYEDHERQDVLRRLESSSLGYVYVADSYGSLLPDEVYSLLQPLVALNRFNVGFHAHNNLQLAFANSLEAMKAGARIVDSTLYGMGRGAGNLATETLLSYLQQQNTDKYNVIHALFCVDMYMLGLKKRYDWGYQLPFMLSAVCQCHPSFAKEVVEAREYTIDELWKILNHIKAEKPVGFQQDLLEKTLETCVFNNRSEKDVEDPAPGPRAMVSSPSGPPDYMDRHKGRVFLVLANGPNLKKYRPSIQTFIEKYHPVIMGANYLGGLFSPDYHAFVNLRRFIRYIDSVDEASNLLLSVHFPSDIVRQHVHRSHEPILFIDRVKGPFTIENGVLSNNCATVSVLLIAVSLAMGASEVFVAGMDGYPMEPGPRGSLFYSEEDESNSDLFIRTRERWNYQALNDLEQYMREQGILGPTLITPTTYEKFFVGITNFI